MFFSARIAKKTLVGLCRRLSTALTAGIDIRSALAREVDRSHGALRRHLLAVRNGIDQGDSLAHSLASTNDFFPALFREMVGLGEETGHLDAILAQLADHYEYQIQLRRNFLTAIIWPMVQFTIAIFVVGGLIWMTAILRDLTGNKTLDILGLGLAGTQGLTIYAAWVGGVLAAVWLFFRAVSRGMLWTKPFQYLILRLPIIGGPVRTLALARLAWSLHITLYAGMDLRKALQLSLRSTQNARYIGQIPWIDAEIEQGNTLLQAFTRAGGYPAEFLDVVAVGEDSGRLVESLEILSRQYHDQARSAIGILTTMAGWLVWAGVAALILTVVVKLFSFYLGILNDATKM